MKRLGQLIYENNVPGIFFYFIWHIFMHIIFTLLVITDSFKS